MITIVACLHFCVRPAHLNLQIKFFESAMFGREHQVGNVLHVMYVHNRVLWFVCFLVCAQPSIDASGNIIPHSILGTVEDFKFEARKHDNCEVSSTCIFLL